ncbi:unnamed protein product, partial [Durusdinium trenchii]
SLNEPSAFGCGVGPSPKHHGFRCFSLLTWCFECASDEASDLDAFRTLSDGRQSSVADCGAGCELEVSNRVWLSFGAGREELAASRASGELGLHFSGICRPLGAYSSLDFGLRRMVPTSAERGHCLGDPQKSCGGVSECPREARGAGFSRLLSVVLRSGIGPLARCYSAPVTPGCLQQRRRLPRAAFSQCRSGSVHCGAQRELYVVRAGGSQGGLSSFGRSSSKEAPVCACFRHLAIWGERCACCGVNHRSSAEGRGSVSVVAHTRGRVRKESPNSCRSLRGRATCHQ